MAENNPLRLNPGDATQLQVKLDSKGKLVISYGYDLFQNKGDAEGDFAAIGVTLTAEQRSAILGLTNAALSSVPITLAELVLPSERWINGTHPFFKGFDIDGTEGDDNGEPGAAPQLIGTSVTDRIQAFGGNDVAAGGGGDDTLFGGSGNDLLHGDADNVPAANQGADFLSGGTGMMERINGTHPFFYSFFTRQR